jgi:actin-like ATPase involved in cell morphogenesis
MITGATEEKRESLFDICVHKEIEKKAPKWVTTQQKKRVKNCTPNQNTKSERKNVHKFMMNESDRQVIIIFLSFILNIQKSFKRLITIIIIIFK